MPALKSVFSDITIDGASELTYVDLTGLEHTQSLVIREAPKLQRTDLGNFKSFLSVDLTRIQKRFEVIDSVRLESINSMFKGPLQNEPEGARLADFGDPDILLGTTPIQLADDPAIEWASIGSLQLATENKTLILGGPDTPRMNITVLILRGTDLRRHVATERLIVKKSFLIVTGGPTTLTLPFTEIKELSIEDNLPDQSLGQTQQVLNELIVPAAAENWNMSEFYIQRGLTPNLRIFNDQGERIWHWPRRIDRLHLEGNMTEDFL